MVRQRRSRKRQQEVFGAQAGVMAGWLASAAPPSVGAAVPEPHQEAAAAAEAAQVKRAADRAAEAQAEATRTRQRGAQAAADQERYKQRKLAPGNTSRMQVVPRLARSISSAGSSAATPIRKSKPGGEGSAPPAERKRKRVSVMTSDMVDTITRVAYPYVVWSVPYIVVFLILPFTLSVLWGNDPAASCDVAHAICASLTRRFVLPSRACATKKRKMGGVKT